MVAVKGKLRKPLNRIGDQCTVGIKGFKVYVEEGKAEVSSSGSNGNQQKALFVPPGRKSVTFSEKSTEAMASNLKGGAKTLESWKAKRDSTTSLNAGRRVLADVSNVRSNSTKGKDGSKQLTTARKVPPLIRKSILAPNTGYRADTSATEDKGKEKENRRQVVALYPALKRGCRDFKPSISDQRSKIQGHGCLNTDGRINARKPLPPSRKSLPLSKLASQLYMGNKKATGDNMEKGIHGFLGETKGKEKFGQKVMPQVSNARAHVWRNRVSDGFILMASKNQPVVNGRAFPRKSLKTRKTTNVNSSAKIGLKSKDKEVASSSGNSTTAEEPLSLGEAPSECNSNTSRNKLDKDAMKKTRRRKSFTSLLMAKSNVQNEKGQCLEQKLPSIYDDGNHIEAPEYVDDIYQYYWTMEAQSGSLVNYMEIQTEITPQMRNILVNWLIEVHVRFDLMSETIYLTITLLDQYLSLVTIKKDELQLVGLTALLLASKYEDFWHPRVSDLISISVDSYTRNQMLGMEKAFLKKLKFRLNAPTLYVFMLRFLKASKSDKKLEDLSFYLIDLCMISYEALRFKSSLLCASAIYVARCTLQMTPTWSQLLCIYSHYEESQLRDCAEMVLKLQKSAKTSKLKVTYEKYSKMEHSQVANIKPLNKLPFN